jgi:hypothetical protein
MVPSPISRKARVLDKIREVVLTLWLNLIYWSVLTPLGIVQRLLGRGFPAPEARRGWQKINQRSCDRKMFEDKF